MAEGDLGPSAAGWRQPSGAGEWRLSVRRAVILQELRLGSEFRVSGCLNPRALNPEVLGVRCSRL